MLQSSLSLHVHYNHFNRHQTASLNLSKKTVSEAVSLRVLPHRTATPCPPTHANQPCHTVTYDHTHWRIRDPVCSPIDKPVRARLVVGSLTTSESLVLYVFCSDHFVDLCPPPFSAFPRALFWTAHELFRPHPSKLGFAAPLKAVSFVLLSHSGFQLVVISWLLCTFIHARDCNKVLDPN